MGRARPPKLVAREMDETMRIHSIGNFGATLCEYLVAGKSRPAIEILQGSVMDRAAERAFDMTIDPGAATSTRWTDILIWYGYEFDIDQHSARTSACSIAVNAKRFQLLVVEPWSFEGRSRHARYRRDRRDLSSIFKVEDVRATYPKSEAFTLHEAFVTRASQLYSILAT